MSLFIFHVIHCALYSISQILKTRITIQISVSFLVNNNQKNYIYVLVFGLGSPSFPVSISLLVKYALITNNPNISVLTTSNIYTFMLCNSWLVETLSILSSTPHILHFHTGWKYCPNMARAHCGVLYYLSLLSWELLFRISFSLKFHIRICQKRIFAWYTQGRSEKVAITLWRISQ